MEAVVWGVQVGGAQSIPQNIGLTANELRHGSKEKVQGRPI